MLPVVGQLVLELLHTTSCVDSTSDVLAHGMFLSFEVEKLLRLHNTLPSILMLPPLLLMPYCCLCLLSYTTGAVQFTKTTVLDWLLPYFEITDA